MTVTLRIMSRLSLQWFLYVATAVCVCVCSTPGEKVEAGDLTNKHEKIV